MGVVLENVRKEAAEGNYDTQQAMNKIGGAYFRQREVSAQGLWSSFEGSIKKSSVCTSWR